MRFRLTVVSVLLASCSGVSAPTLPSITPYKIDIRQGNLVTADMREKVKVGMTASQVRAALGTPLIVDPFHANRWDYQYRYEQEGKLVRQQRLTLYFEGDRLARIDEHEMPQESAAVAPSKAEGGAPAVAEPVAATPVTVEAAAPVVVVNAESTPPAAPAPVPVEPAVAAVAPMAVSSQVTAPTIEPSAPAAEPGAEAPAKMEAVPQAPKLSAAENENKAEHKKMVELYREGANEGNAEAQFNLGRMYDFGYGVPQNFKVAAEWYRKAAAQGYAQAYYNLGVMNDLGRGTKKDAKKAAARYRQAAELGDAKGQYTLGMMYAKGRGVPQSDEMALSWYRKAAAHWDTETEALAKAEPLPIAIPPAEVPATAEAAPQVAEKQATDPEHNPEYKKMVEVYRQGAKVGNAEAQYNLGQMYELGYGVPQDYKTASDWYRKAGKQGFAKALFNLGVMNALGRGTKHDDKKAAARFREAAELGDAQAQYTLGMMYSKGVGVPKDDKIAMSWYQKAAAQGYAEAEAIVKAEPAPEATPPVAAEPVTTAAAPPVAEMKVEPLHKDVLQPAEPKAAPAPEAIQAQTATAPAPKVAEAKVEPAPAPKAEPAPEASRAASAAEVQQAITEAVKSWAAAWSSQDVAQYLASYARTFKPAEGLSRKAWEAQRRERIAKPKSITVELSDIVVGEQGKSAVSVRFKQSYRTDSYKDVTSKTLELKKIGEKWLIVSERAETLEAVHLAAAPKAEAASKVEPAPKAESTPKPELATSAARPAKAEAAPKAELPGSAPRTLSAESEQAIADAVKSWAAAWSAQDVAKYLDSYAQAFKPADGMTRAAWEAQRRERVAKPKSIKVELSGINVSGQGEDSARVSFKQDYRADKYKDITNKTLELKKIGDKWLIMSEQVNKK